MKQSVNKSKKSTVILVNLSSILYRRQETAMGNLHLLIKNGTHLTQLTEFQT